MVATEQAFLKAKLFGQPYIPTDFKQLVFVTDIQLRRLSIYAKSKFLEHYLDDSSQPWGYFALLRDIVFVFWVYSFLYRVLLNLYGYGLFGCFKKIKHSISKWFFGIVMSLPPIKAKVDRELQTTAVKMEEMIIKNDDSLLQFPELPKVGMHKDVVIQEVSLTEKTLAQDDWHDGKYTGGVYHGGDELLKLQAKAYEIYSVANQLHPDIFPGIRKMEAEVVSMILKIFNAPDTGCGCSTSGGTESLLLTGLAAREFGRRRKGIKNPEVIAPITVHAGIDKACYYFGMKLHKVDVDPKTYQVDIKKVRRLINKNTVLLVGSAPNYPHGIIDDIEALSDLAIKHNILLHVDACLGSFLVTYLEKSGIHGDTKLPMFDFRLPGVTSISCDTHKYGFAPKGSSVILYRNPEIRKHQYYVASDWTGGLYGSPTLAGSRPGALMAGCWATLVYIGDHGYTESCKEIVGASLKLKESLKTNETLLEHLEILGDPLVSVIAFKAKNPNNVDIYSIGDLLGKRGWHFATLQNPPALHFAFTRLTVPVVDDLIGDLIDVVTTVANSDTKAPPGDTAAMYGVAGNVSTAGVADRLIETFLDALYKL
ncbi:Dihydrosphingosine phosphate lyase [Candidozyma auris]|uniref:sphinganine-1-phosphate aldolase n=2 Tax=Candidozyma auris TaxID=498019 RepID=A0A2H0ZW79_CANAR|nr:sphinganine-1-phosphate aldolase DPL1 [[Candida] auris]KND95570.1 dihydrosphingosine-1-phosphate lyase [[Candida] auris]PIS52548.1 hypothetical protein CJI97_002196 [[Candida] auris]PIS54858.1 hypothetical protein B9J08_002005 [[Candida] auris]QEO21826.1 hypothetical_protein [[Candida] auris]